LAGVLSANACLQQLSAVTAELYFTALLFPREVR
jgi:hypothetical protein